ncbi:S-adenosyl-L-methionine-dependent methyltransferase, partial [Naematelia encephala]
MAEHHHQDASDSREPDTADHDWHSRVTGSRRPPRSPSPSTTASFSINSSVDFHVFRVDDGRRYQARNDDYTLPADFRELERLDAQHYGFKAAQAGKNYIGPMDEALPNGGAGKRILDIGTGTGIWAVEIAREFPRAEVYGMDLSPVQHDLNLPENVAFLHEDCTKGLPFPNGHFDVIHSRALVAGIRDWRAFISEANRVLAPGGLILCVEMAGLMRIDGIDEEEADAVAPGFMALSREVERSLTIRRLDVNAATKTIEETIATHPELHGFQRVYGPLPLWPWSDDPDMKEAGRVMLSDAQGES